MSNQLEASQAEVVIPAGEKTSVTDKPEMNVENEDNIQIGPISSRTLRKGVPETFMGPTPESRYHSWQSYLKEAERTQPEFDKWKSTFEARMQGKIGPKPTVSEIAEYRSRCDERDERMYPIKAFKDSYDKEFKVTTLPKNIPEALELLDRMKPWKQNMIRPKGYREGLALAAPGGVVDEEELDTDALFVQQSMMTERQKALEEEGPASIHNMVGGRKKKNKKGKWKSQVTNAISSEESKGGGEGNDRIIPIEETLWYSPPHFPRLAKALLQVASQLERRIGTERAIASLHTALTDEALNAETVCQTLVAEGEHYYKQCKHAVSGVRDDALLQKAANYFERAAALGYETALMRAGNIYNVLHNHTKARALLVQASDRGISELTMYTALGWYYLEGIGGPPDGKKADHYLAPFTHDGDPSTVRLQYILRSRLYTYGLGPIKPDIVIGFAFLRAALLINSNIGKDMNWYDFYPLARGYRYGLLVDADPVKALKYYNMTLDTYKSCSDVSSVAQPHLPRILKEAKAYKEMMKWGKDSLVNDPRERTTRFKLLLASLNHPFKDIQSALQYALGMCYRLGDGVTEDIDSAKEYLIKASQHQRDPRPEAAYQLALLYAEKLKAEDMINCIPLAESISGRLSSEQLCNLYYLAIVHCREKVKEEKRWEADLLKYCDKMILLKHPYGWFSKARAYLSILDDSIKQNVEKALCCYVNAEKLLLAQAKNGDKRHACNKYLSEELSDEEALLGDVYLDMGLCYVTDLYCDEEKQGKRAPLNREKGIMYLKKSMALGRAGAIIPLARSYFYARTHYSDPNNPGDPVKAFGLYKSALDIAYNQGSVPPDIFCEYGLLLLTGRGGVLDPVRGLSFLERGTQEMLRRKPSDDNTKGNVHAYASALMDTYYKSGDHTKGDMYREHCHRLLGIKETSSTN